MTQVYLTSRVKTNLSTVFLQKSNNNRSLCGSSIIKGGLTINENLFNSERQRWKAEVEPKVDRWDMELLQERFPPFYRQTLQEFRLDNFVGIPPNIRKYDVVGKKTTHGLIVYIGLEILKQLQNASNAESGIAQLFESIDCPTQRAKKKAEEIEYTFENGFYVTDGISPGGREIFPYEEKMYSSLQTKHIVFIAKNGAMQILKLPTPKELSKITENDVQAQKEILTRQPLNGGSGSMGFTEKYIGSIQELLSFLDELEKGKHPERVTTSGGTDITSILSVVAFDYAKHINSGYLKVLVNKSGVDGKSVWETIQ